MELKTLDLVKYKNGEELNITNGYFSDSDIDKSDNNSKIDKINEENNEIYNLYNNDNNHNNEININNINEYIIEANNDYNISNTDNNTESKKDEDSKIHYDLIKELNDNQFIFIRNYSDEIIDENNKLYVSWLKKNYVKINNLNSKNYLNKINIFLNTRKSPNFPELIQNIKENLFICENPICKSIIYLTENQKKKLKEIKNVSLVAHQYDFYFILNYQKIRCPLCLKYKCIYCHRSSTLKSSFCCLSQYFMTCYNADVYQYLYPLAYSIHIPIIRVWFLSFVANFFFFRSITKKNKLLEKT